MSKCLSKFYVPSSPHEGEHVVECTLKAPHKGKQHVSVWTTQQYPTQWTWSDREAMKA